MAAKKAEETSAQLLQEEQAAADAEQRAKARSASKKDKKARQKQRKQVYSWGNQALFAIGLCCTDASCASHISRHVLHIHCPSSRQLPMQSACMHLENLDVCNEWNHPVIER